MSELKKFGKITEDPDGALRIEGFHLDCCDDPHAGLVLAIVDRLLESINQNRYQAGAEAMRERCAVECEKQVPIDFIPRGDWAKGFVDAVRDSAKAIRALETGK